MSEPQPHREPDMATVRILADWGSVRACIKRIYLFGSRARGDHRPDSDVDVCVEFDYSLPSEAYDVWMADNQNDFADLKAMLPGPLALHQDRDDPAWPAIYRAAQASACVLDKVVCCATPSKHTS